MKKFLMFLLFFGFLTSVVTMPTTEALAVSDEANSKFSTMTDTLCTIMKFVTGSVGKAFASFAVIFVGVGFLAGKTTWTAMITFALGIAAIFGAPKIISAFTGGSTVCDSSGS